MSQLNPNSPQVWCTRGRRYVTLVLLGGIPGCPECGRYDHGPDPMSVYAPSVAVDALLAGRAAYRFGSPRARTAYDAAIRDAILAETGASPAEVSAWLTDRPGPVAWPSFDEASDARAYGAAEPVDGPGVRDGQWDDGYPRL